MRTIAAPNRTAAPSSGLEPVGADAAGPTGTRVARAQAIDGFIEVSGNGRVGEDHSKRDQADAGNCLTEDRRVVQPKPAAQTDGLRRAVGHEVIDFARQAQDAQNESRPPQHDEEPDEVQRWEEQRLQSRLHPDSRRLAIERRRPPQERVERACLHVAERGNAGRKRHRDDRARLATCRRERAAGRGA
jgi:hypothetical protein